MVAACTQLLPTLIREGGRDVGNQQEGQKFEAAGAPQMLLPEGAGWAETPKYPPV